MLRPRTSTEQNIPEHVGLDSPNWVPSGHSANSPAPGWVSYFARESPVKPLLKHCKQMTSWNIVWSGSMLEEFSWALMVWSQIVCDGGTGPFCTVAPRRPHVRYCGKQCAHPGLPEPYFSFLFWSTRNRIWWGPAFTREVPLCRAPLLDQEFFPLRKHYLVFRYHHQNYASKR